MFLRTALCGLALLCLIRSVSYAQEGARANVDSVADKTIGFPSRLLGKLQARTDKLNTQLTQQTTSWLQKMQRREEKMRRKLAAVDSAGAKQLFDGSQQQYAALAKKIQSDTGTAAIGLKGTYLPYADSLQGAMKFLGAGGQMQALQAKIADAGDAQVFVQQRKQQISQYISQHTDLQNLLGKQYTGFNPRTSITTRSS